MTDWRGHDVKIRPFILGEVERQGFDIGTQNFNRRVKWMADAWEYAQAEAGIYRFPTIEHILKLAAMVEHEENMHGFRTHGVSVGGRVCVDWHEVPRLVASLVAAIPRLTANEFYLEFELIHPFGDGNGRTGKILHNWLMDTLDDPILVEDYFGKGLA